MNIKMENVSKKRKVRQRRKRGGIMRQAEDG